MTFVKVHAERGHGNDVWEVIATDGIHFSLKNTKTGQRIRIYIAHTYRDVDCSRARMEAAEKIGKPRKVNKVVRVSHRR